MNSQKRDSVMKKTLESLCCSYGWSYGVFWGFDQTNSLLLTFKDAYYEEQVGALIDSLLLQAHILGGGLIGQAAFTKNHRWMYSDALHESQNSCESFDSLDVLQDEYEFFYQFSLGIKTIAVISVEPWGVVQLGSTKKNPENKSFVDRVKQLFRETNEHVELKTVQNVPYSVHSEGLMEAYHSLVLQSQSFPCDTSDYQTRNLIFPTVSPIENPSQIDSGNIFDSFAVQPLNDHSDGSVFTSYWPHLAPMGYELCENSSLGSPLNLDEFFHGNNFAVSKHGLEDDFSQWFTPTPIYKSENLPTNSLQSSVTDAFISNLEVKNSECISEKYIGSKTWTPNSLFSKLGLDQLLDRNSPCPKAQSTFEDRSSSDTKRRKIDDFSYSHNQGKLECLPSFSRKMKSIMYDSEAKKIELNSDDPIKETCSFVGDSCIVDVGKTSSSKGQVEQAKTKKKKSIPGTRPRPKDRQMIQDRLAELRELIPNGEKMSIDRLLERTIRHLNFMQSLTKHAHSLKQIDKAKNVEVQKSQSINGGVTWACEVGDHLAMVCPLMVEDLSTPGQMLIEMLCEEHGFFLEIVDVIRGFGLIIRNGVMEVRETNKIWAHFLVEAEGNRLVSRHEIFSSLIQLLQMSGQSAVNENDRYCNIVSSEVPALSNFQSSASLPVNLRDAIRCANL